MTTTTTPQPFEGDYQVDTDGVTVSVVAHLPGEIIKPLVRFVANGDDSLIINGNNETYQQEMATAGYFAASKDMYALLCREYPLFLVEGSVTLDGRRSGRMVYDVFPEVMTLWEKYGGKQYLRGITIKEAAGKMREEWCNDRDAITHRIRIEGSAK